MTGEEAHPALVQTPPSASSENNFCPGGLWLPGAGGSGSCLSGCPKVLNLALHFPAASL